MKSIIAILLLSGTSQLPAQESPQPGPNAEVAGIINWGIGVADLEKSERFYLAEFAQPGQAAGGQAPRPQ